MRKVEGLKTGTLASFVAADRVVAANDGRVALALQIAADRIDEDLGSGIVVDLHISLHVAGQCIAYGRIVVAGEIARDFGIGVADKRPRAVLDADITANDGGYQFHSPEH